MSISFQLNRKKYRLKPTKNVNCILIHGSYVHGEYNKNSDIDFIIVVNKNSSHKTKVNIARQLKLPLHWFRAYSKNDLKLKANKGDYFLWSVKLHHKIIYKKNNFIIKLFKNIKPYTAVRKTLFKKYLSFNALIKRHKQNKLKDKIICYKIGHFIRNTCINILYLNGIVEFGKYKSVRLCKKYKLVKLPFTPKEYRRLYYRDKISKKQVAIWYKKYRMLLKQCLAIEKKKKKTNFISPLIKRSRSYRK